MKYLASVVLLLCATFSFAAEAPRDLQMDQLLQLIKQGMVQDASEQRKRLSDFIRQRDQQTRLLNERKQVLEDLKRTIEGVERSFEDNEVTIANLEQRLDERLGGLKELFGVLQQVSGDARGSFQGSPTSSQYPGRLAFLDGLIEKAGSSSTLPSIEELEQLWFELQQEMVASGQITRYPATVVAKSGETGTREVIRVGTFNVVSADGQYLNWEAQTQKLVELPKQPEGRYTSAAGSFASAGSGQIEDFWLDPSGGSLLSLLLQSPTFGERIDQGGLIGYIILLIGFFALLLVAERLYSLGRVSMRVNKQMGSDTPDTDNPLGRVMATYVANQHKDTETLELKLGETIAQEVPKLTRFLPLLKIIAVVAPLLGLLGTVTGMINTFQAITLFGTGDPKLMAGGISQALVTTVMGLSVAIPAVLLHTVVSGRSRRLMQILEERSIGIIARREETKSKAAPTAAHA